MTRSLLLILLVLLQSCSKVPEKNVWAELAKQDLNEIHDQLRENHPGSVDKENPSFNNWLFEGLKKSSEMLGKVDSYGAYQSLIRYYVNGFQDSHLGVRFLISADEVAWPGFLVGYHNGKYIVEHIGNQKDYPTSVQRGEEILSCDGIEMEKLYVHNILPFRGINEVISYHYRLSSLIFLDEDNPFLKLPTECDVKGKNSTRTITLNWKGVTRSKFEELLWDKILGNEYKFGFHKLGDGGYWISTPRFWAQGKELDELNATINEAKRHSDQMKVAPYVVFDVRGNTGGSSEYGVQLANALWGKEYVGQFSTESHAVDFKISTLNIAHYEKMVEVLKEKFGEQADFTNYFRDALTGMKKAHADGKSLWRKGTTVDVEKSAARKTTNVKAKVYFLTDSFCNSACLDFADIVLPIPGVEHIGLPTSADTAYMEVRGVVLKNRAARFTIPTKVYRGKVRANNEAYVPRDIWTGDITDTGALKKYVQRKSRPH